MTTAAQARQIVAEDDAEAFVRHIATHGKVTIEASMYLPTRRMALVLLNADGTYDVLPRVDR